VPGVTFVRDEDGLTLIELLTTMLIGSVVLGALFTLINQAMPAERKISDRVEAQQRGRIALSRMTTDLRNAVCVSGASGVLQAPLISAGDNQITLYDSVATGDTSDFNPKIVQLVYDPVAKTLVRKTWTWSWSTGALPPDPTTAPSDPPDQTVLTNVNSSGQANTARPAAVFGLIKLDGTNPIDPTTMTAADLAAVDRVRIGIVVGPKNGTTYAAGNATFSDDIAIRLPPTYSNGVATGGPACII
jgi:type II secretory pathway component PulJ